jgi:hypothetical protein
LKVLTEAHAWIERGRREAHIGMMKITSLKAGKSRTPPPGTPGWYRGIKLAPLVNPPTTPADVLDRAIREAFAERADKLATRK